MMANELGATDASEGSDGDYCRKAHNANKYLNDVMSVFRPTICAI
jgi:hypothetical protein